ncbi:MAG: C45 family autoproteolytic acyltransferase/hydrolase [Deltaproteobacteria bacterium]|nr:C45 family autoproteolytic acyltransferase/hydrolase [Deltaproteobacteria bacterium]
MKPGIIKIILLFAIIVLLLSGCESNSNRSARSNEFEGGKKQVYDYVPTVVLSGNWKQMGRQYGYFLSDDIRAVYNLVSPYKDKINRGCGKVNSEIIEELYQSYPQRFKEFFQGMSETSGLTLEQLKVANSLEIVLMFGSESYNTRCSALSTWGDYSTGGKVIYGRNYDYNTEFLPLNDHIVVTVFHPDNGDIPFAMITWAGCIYASSGINQKGIYVEENDCSPHDKQAAGYYETGDHLNMKTWVKDDAMLLSLLTQAGTLFEADTWMKNNLPCYPHNIGVANKNEARSYQWNIAERIPHARRPTIILWCLTGGASDPMLNRAAPVRRSRKAATHD